MANMCLMMCACTLHVYTQARGFNPSMAAVQVAEPDESTRRSCIILSEPRASTVLILGELELLTGRGKALLFVSVLSWYSQTKEMVCLIRFKSILCSFFPPLWSCVVLCMWHCLFYLVK